MDFNWNSLNVVSYIHNGLFYFTFTLPVLKIEAMSSTGGVWISTGIASTGLEAARLGQTNPCGDLVGLP